MLTLLKRWFGMGIDGVSPAGALDSMNLGPQGNQNNPLMIQFFTWDSGHPDLSWWQHFEAEVPRLAELGVTQVWLPPAHKATHKGGQGYDAYDLWDLGEFEQKGTTATRWGTKDELIRAISTAREHGIDVIIDAILNHKLGADQKEAFNVIQVDENNRLKEIGRVKEIEGWTVFDFPGRDGKYSTMRWNHEHFTGLDWDDRTRTKGVYRIVGGRHRGWSRNVDRELGNYDYLLGQDIDHSHPEVQKDLTRWGTWVLDTTGGEGFRLDAIKHIDSKFLMEWVGRVRTGAGRSRAFVVAEYWSANIKLVLGYVRTFRGLVAFFDVPLHDNFHRAAKRPGDAVTFVDNHEQIGQSLESWVSKEFKLQAYAIILLRDQGHPCVFYGDLYPNHECYDEDTARSLARLMQARKDHAYGKQTDYFHYRNCIGFARAGDASHAGCVVVLSNSVYDE
ncbi:glycoside hydrolase family 13 protein [Amylostereum chailletii]|nr:glycoside hydrolase family 13 protein [Amylostereum chailletii]